MRRLVQLAVLASLSAAALLLAATAPAARKDGALVAKVGPGASVSLTDTGGAAVTHLDPGTYTISVDDESDIHNFDLNGPGVTQSTTIEGTGKTTWTVTFTDGTYTFQCDAHPLTMHGSFTVGTGGTTTTTSTPPPPAPPSALPRLNASAGPGLTISVRRPSGALVRTLPHGRYRITVRDRASFHNFHLVGPGLNRKTSVPFVGTATWTVTLKKGVYTYQCDAHKAVMHGSFRVT